MRNVILASLVLAGCNSVYGWSDYPNVTDDAIVTDDANVADTSVITTSTTTTGNPTTTLDTSLPDTSCTPAQTPDWATWTPSDHPNHFTENGDGTISDSHTGLKWLKAYQSTTVGGNVVTTFSWADALHACPCGWRLPQRIELLSIVDFTLQLPALDEGYFDNDRTQNPNYYWTATPASQRDEQGQAWLIEFLVGDVELDDQTAPHQVRCVQGSRSMPSPQYTQLTGAAGNEICDSGSNLCWHSQGSWPLFGSPDQANTTCNNLGTGWRLPSMSELLTLINTSSVDAPAVTNLLTVPSSLGNNFWSNTPYLQESGSFWALAFGDGLAAADDSSDYGICVRTGP